MARSKFKDLTGMRFNRLQVIGEEGKDKHGNVLWLCKCDCGNTLLVKSHNLTHNISKSCGCLYNEMMKDKVVNLVGKRFGKLVVLSQADRDEKGRILWLCKCDCGNTVKVLGAALKNSTKSCGCYRKEYMSKRQKTHGKRNTRIYNTWNAMRQRCNNENSPSYKNYGGRGIKVCEEWESSFEAFYAWAMNNGYEDDLTIERINNDGNYEPSNCRWIPIDRQANNKRSTNYVTYMGKTQSLSDWCRELGLDYKVINERNCNNRNRTPEELFKPVGYTKDMITYNGETLCLSDWCRKLNLNINTIRDRRRRHPEYPPEKLFAPIKK